MRAAGTIGLGIFLNLTLSAPSVAAEPRESFYMVVFASQGPDGGAETSHTFATFVRAATHGDTVDEFDAHTISWGPATLVTVLGNRRPERGANLDLAGSFRWAEALGARVRMWGPYAIRRELYEMALAQEARLQSGAVLYKAIDIRYRPDASNCIHAVADVDTTTGPLHVGRVWGEAASARVVEHLSRWIIDGGRTHRWVADRLRQERQQLVAERVERERE
jgi:hypothetical protein